MHRSWSALRLLGLSPFCASGLTLRTILTDAVTTIDCEEQRTDGLGNGADARRASRTGVSVFYRVTRDIGRGSACLFRCTGNGPATGDAGHHGPVGTIGGA